LRKGIRNKKHLPHATRVAQDTLNAKTTVNKITLVKLDHEARD
jgi:hypothetical protein